MTFAPLPDAAPANWVDRRAPASLRPWLKLGRFDRPVGVWLLMLPGWQGIALFAAMQGRLPRVDLMVLFALGSGLMRAAGCAFNDVVDRDLDAKVARTAARPVASGRIGVKGALGFIAGCCLASVGILLLLNPLAGALAVASLGLVAAYPFMKRITWWPQAWLGLTFNWGALMGFAAAGGGASLLQVMQGRAGGSGGALTAPALLLYAGGVAWTLGYDTIYAVQDLEDDALAGVKSSARRLGAAAARGVLTFYLAAFALALAAGLAARLGPLFYLLLVFYGAHLVRQPRRLDLADPALALRLFKSNREAGLILLSALVAGAWRPQGGMDGWIGG
jgi:4-hydroxybenzoate polyprenyltransferase